MKTFELPFVAAVLASLAAVPAAAQGNCKARSTLITTTSATDSTTSSGPSTSTSPTTTTTTTTTSSSSSTTFATVTVQAVPVTSTTSTPTSTSSPPAPLSQFQYILRDSGYDQWYISYDSTKNNGQVILTQNEFQASVFYTDPSTGNPRSVLDPTFVFAEFYAPNSATANDNIHLVSSSASGAYPITCNYKGIQKVGDFWGQCSSSGSPSGNPNTYGFGNCPNNSPNLLYMFPNDSNVKCYNGGYAFIGFKAVAVPN